MTALPGPADRRTARRSPKSRWLWSRYAAPSGKVVNGVELDLPVSLQAAAGIAGPAMFTGAWIASSLRQTRQGPGGLQLSGLAAPDARDPWIMLAGFLVAGGCTAAFGAALREVRSQHATGGAGPGPALVQGAGLLTVAAGPAAPRPHAARRVRRAGRLLA